MANKIDDIEDLEANYYKLDDIIKKKLYSIRNELKISFIGKVSTPKNLLINQLTNVDFPSYNTSKRTLYCTIISEWHDANRSFSVISEYKEAYQKCKNNYGSNKKMCGIALKNGMSVKPIKELGSYLNEYSNQDIDKFEIFLSKSENSILNQCIIYNNPPIGYSHDLDEFVVEQSYKSCYLYIFLINKDESILEEEMKIIGLLMEKRKVIELKFVIACSRDMSREDYIKIEQDYVNKIKAISERFPGIIIISGHGYLFGGKKSKNNIETNESNSGKPTITQLGDLVKIPIDYTRKIASELKFTNVVPKENRIKDLGIFIREKPTAEMISTAVIKYKLKMNSSVKSEFVSDKENIKRELQNSIENVEKIINFVSKFYKSNELKDKIFQFNETISSISLDKIYGSNFVIIGNPLISSLDILKGLIGQPILHDGKSKLNFSIITCNFNQTNHEYFVLQNDNNEKHDICELNNLSELISNLQLSSNENISIELYLDNETHPIINDEMKIIYYNDFDINNGDLLKEYEDYDGIAVILDHRSGSYSETRDKIKYLPSKHLCDQTSILVNYDEKENPHKFLQIEIAAVIKESNFNLIFYRILSNLKYRKIANEIKSLFQNFISQLDESISFEGNIKEISDWKFQELDDIIINSRINSIQNDSRESENIKKIVNEEISKFASKIFMENMDISDEKFSSINVFEDEEIKKKIFSKKNFLKKNFLKKNHFLNYYAADRTNFLKTINETYISKAGEIFSDFVLFRKTLNKIIDNLTVKCYYSNVFVFNA